MHSRRAAFTLSLALALLPCLILTTAAQGGPPPPPTNVLYGIISNSRTLAYAYPGPVYYVPGDVVVKPGATLTIEPGVTLQFTANQDTLGGGDYPALAELDIQGALVADATSGDSIRFVSSGGGAGQWGKIKVEGAASVVLRRASIRGAVVGIQAVGQGSVENCTISATATGALIQNNVAVRRSTIADAVNGIDASGGGASIQECVIKGTGTSGIGLSIGSGASTAVADSTDPRPTLVSRFSTGVSVLGNSKAEHIVSYNNIVGIGAQCCGSSWAVQYCTVVGNSQDGINFGGTNLQILMSIAASNGRFGIIYGASSPCIASYMDYTDSWSNGSLNYSMGNCAAGPRREAFNPFFINPSANDYRLSSGSIFKTYGPWGAEIGAYGPGPGSPTPATPMTWGRMKASYR